MRQIICRFSDGSTFLQHVERSPFNSGPGQALALNFLADFPIPVGEVVQIAIVIANPGEEHELHFEIAERRPSLSSSTSGIRWRYEATVTDGDAPWLEMLSRKYDTARRLSA